MKIKVMHDIIISHGPQRLFQDQVIDLPDDVAQSMIDRGEAVSAEPIKKKVHKKKESEE